MGDDEFVGGKVETNAIATMFKKVGQKVDLSNATQVYQPVSGTSGGSVYYVFARWPGMNLAVRHKVSQLSIRAEGPKVHDYKSQLEGLGIACKGSSHYSVHLNVGAGPVMYARTLGAVLAGIGIGTCIEVADPLQLPTGV